MQHPYAYQPAPWHQDANNLLAAEGSPRCTHSQDYQCDAPPSQLSASTVLNLAWFFAAVAIMFGAMIGAISCVFSFEWVDSLEMFYLFMFGLVLAILDAPFTNFFFVSMARTGIGRYMHLLTRVLGKSLAFTFLGSALFSAMWSNLESMASLVLAAVLGVYVVIVGIASGAIAMAKSAKLNTIRQYFRGDEEGVGLNAVCAMFQKHAMLQPHLGMTLQEFQNLAAESKGILFDKSDLKLIFNALSSSPKRDAITLSDLDAWVRGPMIIL